MNDVAAGRPSPSSAATWGRDLLAVLPAWVAARVLVAVGYLTAYVAINPTTPEPFRPIPFQQVLLAWDGAFYRLLADVGYVDAPADAHRFFPAYPLLGKVLSPLFLGRTDVALVVLANVAALAAMVLLRRLAREQHDPDVAGTSVWLFSASPVGFALVLAFSEPLMVAAVVATFLLLRHRTWLAAGATGFLAALSRPFGALLAVAALIEAIKRWPRADGRERAAMAAAVAGPLAGLGAFLLYAQLALPEGWRTPLDAQRPLRGDFVEPISRTLRALGELIDLGPTLDGLHAPFALILLALVVVGFRVLPLSQAVYCLLVVVVALSADNLNSLERYGLNAVPLILVAAVVVHRLRIAQAVVVVSAGLFVAMCSLAFLGRYVP